MRTSVHSTYGKGYKMPTSENRSVVAGLFKFQSRYVNKEGLIEYAKVMLARAPEDFLHLYVRGASEKDQLAIGFTYLLPLGQTKHDEFFENETHAMRRMFGNGLIGWDVTTPATVIK